MIMMLLSQQQLYLNLIKDKVINGLPLLTGLGVEQLYKDLKERLGL